MSLAQALSRKAQRALPAILTETVRTGHFPGWTVDLPDPSSNATVESVRQQLQEVRQWEKVGAIAVWEARTTRRLGPQTWPIRLSFPNLSVLGQLVDQPSLRHFVSLANAVLAREPALRTFWENDPTRAWEWRGRWSGLCKAVAWFRNHPRCGLQRRALPWTLHGKFVEENEPILDTLLRLCASEYLDAQADHFDGRWGLARRAPLWRGRILDSRLQQSIGLPADDLAMAISAWLSLPTPDSVVVVENLESMLALGTREGTLAIWGRGWAVTELATWISRIKHVFYWGDLDAQGFEILDSLRRMATHVRSVGMDEPTLAAWVRLSCPGTPASPKELDNLTRTEWNAYRQVVGQNLRIEQEKIPLAWVERILDQAMTKEI